MPVFGYARVSREDQDLALQVDALEAAGVASDRIVREKMSGVLERPRFAKLLASLDSGDTLAVWKVDRLGRNALDVQKTVQTLDERGVRLLILTLGIDTQTPAGRLIFGIMNQLGQFEREQLVERTKAGLEAAKRRGKRLGRKPALTMMQARAAALMVEEGKSYGEVADALNVSRSIAWRAVQQARAKQETGRMGAAV